MMIAKLHGIRVTGADLHYEGSIALDPAQYGRAGLLPFEFVEIWNKNSGHRISTYIIPGRRGSRCCVLNGAAARTCQVGDELIIAARAEVELAELATLRSRVVVFGAGNRIGSVADYRFVTRADGRVEVARMRPAARRGRRA
jgi:aspartate 1-decarboxylase